MVKSVNTGDLKSPDASLPSSSLGTGTIHWRYSSEKQRKQQKLWQALGTVKGFNGYLNNLTHVVKATSISAVDKYFFEQDIATIKHRLAVVIECIELTMKAPK